MRTRTLLAIPVLASLTAAGCAADAPATSGVEASAFRTVTSPWTIQSVSAHVSADGVRHVLVMEDGKLQELPVTPSKTTPPATRGYFDETVGMASYFAASDGQAHLVVADDKGQVREAHWSAAGIADSMLSTFAADIADVGALYAADDKSQHVLVGTAQGDIVEVKWTDRAHLGRATIGHVAGLVAIAGSYNADDHMRVAIVGTSGGDLHEIYYGATSGGADTVLSHFDEKIVDVAAYYSPDDHFRHAIVATAAGNVFDVFYHPSVGIKRALLGTVVGPVSVAAYVASDRSRHVVVATQQGDVKDLGYHAEATATQATLAHFTPAAPYREEASPLETNGTIRGVPSMSGRVLEIGGNEAIQYAVTPNAGLWKATNGGPWAQLAGSPAHAYTLAVEPSDINHVLVGERNGDSDARVTNDAGVWETFNGGGTWSRALNPLRASNCFTQSVRSIAFSRASSIFAASPCGLFRRRLTDSEFTVLPASAGTNITAVSVTQGPSGIKRVWARAPDMLFVSENDGDSWTTIPIPTTLPVPNRAAQYQIDVGSARGAVFSLASADDTAMIQVSMTNLDALKIPGNVFLLVYSAKTGLWRAQQVIAPPPIGPVGSGVGLGGRLFVRSLLLDYDLPGKKGPQTAILVGSAQEIYRATPNADGTLSFTLLTDTTGTGNGDASKPVHSDIWWAHVPPNYGSNSNTVWLAGDGGVYRKASGDALWRTQNEGLHNHHAQTLTSLLNGHTNRSRLMYATGDNDQWERDSTPFGSAPASWVTRNLLGDANWTAGDRENPALGLFVRAPGVADLTDFGHAVSGAATTKQVISFSPEGSVNAESFHFIQSMQGEAVPPLLDAVMLVTDPSTWPTPANPNGGPVVIRNRAFAQHPSYPASKSNWTVELNDLPKGTVRFWVSGGHTNPTYYAYAESVDPKDPSSLTGQALYRRSGGSWRMLSVGSALVTGGGAAPYAAEYGPLWVSGYDPDTIYVLTTDGVKVGTWTGAAMTFSAESQLTALLTGSGQYPLGGGVSSNADDIPDGASNMANPLATMTQLAWNPENPDALVASSPFTGVFYADSRRRVWRSLTPYLPTPLTMVSDVALDFDAVTASFEGRSVVRVHEVAKAPVATYFRWAPSTDHVAALFSTYQTPLTNVPVSVTVTQPNGSVLGSNVQTTDSNGQLVLPSTTAQGTDVVVRLTFAGDRTYAPSDSARELTAPNPQPEVITVSKSGNGTVSGAGIACGSTCTASYAFGAHASLTATPDAGSQFVGWSGDCAGNATCELTMDGSKAVTATFQPIPPQTRTLTIVMQQENFQVLPADADVTSVPPFVACHMSATQSGMQCAAQVPVGTTVTLTGTANGSARFDGFSGGGCSGPGATCAVVMNGDQTVTGAFIWQVP